MSAIINKRCPKCNQVDLTDFSKCRNCGAKYDRKVEPTAKGENPLIYWAIAGGFVVMLFAFQSPIISAVEKMSGASTISTH